MFLYEFFRKTGETYVCSQYVYNYKLKEVFINIDIPYFKHMLEQFSLNSNININVNFIGDVKLDYHHSVEDIGIVLGKLFYYFIGSGYKKKINRYGFAYTPLDESLSRVIVDISGRSYLSYNVFYYNLYVKNFNVNLFYDFFLSFTNNSKITIYIDNIVGFNLHHIFESIFKSFGSAINNGMSINKTNNTSKGFIS